MPVSHIYLTVSHLPTSCSFYLAALQPLGYHYLGQQENQIGLGINEADFFICQTPPGSKSGAAHIAFTASSKQVVDSFYAAALKAGGRSHDSPATRDSKSGYYSAAVIDLDDNAVEVVYQDRGKAMSTVSRPKGSRVSYVPAGSVATNNVSERSPLRTIVSNIITTTTVMTSPTAERKGSTEDSKALMGTLLGAAAGATIAYAMVKGESNSTSAANPEARRSTTVYQTIEAPPTPRSTVSKHRSISGSTNAYDMPSGRSTYTRAIEAPPTPMMEYYEPSVHSRRALPPPPSVHTSATTTARTVRPDREPSHVSRSVRHVPAPSHASHPARGPQTRSMTYPTRSQHTIRPYEVALPPPASPSAAYREPADFPLPASARTSFASRPPAALRSAASASTVRPLTHANVERAGTDIDDLETVAPDDSISQASAKPRRRKHRHRNGSVDGESRRERRREGGSAATVPAKESKREKEPRSVVTAFGLGGRS